MTSETNCIGDDNLRLIDIAEEDDYLIEFPFRDPFQDFRLSVTFDNVREFDRIKLRGGVSSSQTQDSVSHESESVEPRRPSFLRKSIAWDSAFFTSAGVLNPEELFMVNKGLKKAEVKQSSSGTRKSTRPHQVSGSDHKSSESNGFYLETLEGNLFRGLKPNLHKVSKKAKVAINNAGPGCDQANASSGKEMNIFPQNKVKSTQAPKNKSLNLQGPKLISSRQTNNVALEGSAKLELKTRKAGMAPDLTMSKRSRKGDLSDFSKSKVLNSPKIERKTKFHGSYESCSSASSSKNLYKSIKKVIKPRNTKPTNSPSSVQFPLASTCSSSTSPASSFDGWLSETLSPTTTTNHNPTPASEFQSQNSEKRMLPSQNATRSLMRISPASGVPKEKIISSGLRMPSAKIGFFDEEPTFRFGMQDHFKDQSPLSNESRQNKLVSPNFSPSVSTENCLRVGKFLSSENVGRVGGNCSKLKADRQIPKEISRNRKNMEQKRQKEDIVFDIKKMHDSDQWENQKENVCSFEDQVNGISRHLEVIDLDRDLIEVKSQQSYVKPSQTSLPPTDEYITPCSRPPLAEKVVGN